MGNNYKIGIMTLSASDNCGSLLQCYALKRLLEEYGDVEVINFSSENSHRVYDLPKLSILEKIQLSFDKGKRNKFEKLKKSKEAYQSFRHFQLGMNDEELLPYNLEEIKELYGIVVAGSDQIWNVQMGDFDESFFLGWTNAKKVAYAPSLGGRDVRLSNNAQYIIDCIKDFNYLSVREEIGKKCLEEVSSRTVEKVLDPTLVLQEEEWKKLVGEPLISGDYIFYYSWAYCYEDQLEIVSKEGRRLGMPVIVIDARKWYNKDEEKFGFKLSESEGPLAFLNLMYYANRAYVESFHGMVFAYIFRKNFWLMDWHKNINELDSRILEFVDLLGAHKRILTPYNYERTDLEEKMEYPHNENLEKLQEVSKNYLRESMSIRLL